MDAGARVSPESSFMSDAAIEKTVHGVGPPEVVVGMSAAIGVGRERSPGLEDSDAASAGIQAQVAAMTRRIFGGEASVRRESDPEIPVDYFAVYAIAQGDPQHVLAQNDEWHRTLRSVAGDLALYFRLSLDVQ